MKSCVSSIVSSSRCGCARSYKLDASGGAGVTGLGITLKVMSGDTIDILGKSYYFSNAGSPAPSIPALDILSGLLGAPSGAAAGKGATAEGLNAISSIVAPINAFGIGNGNHLFCNGIYSP